MRGRQTLEPPAETPSPYRFPWARTPVLITPNPAALPAKQHELVPSSPRLPCSPAGSMPYPQLRAKTAPAKPWPAADVYDEWRLFSNVLRRARSRKQILRGRHRFPDALDSLSAGFEFANRFAAWAASDTRLESALASWGVVLGERWRRTGTLLTGALTPARYGLLAPCISGGVPEFSHPRLQMMPGRAAPASTQVGSIR